MPCPGYVGINSVSIDLRNEFMLSRLAASLEMGSYCKIAAVCLPVIVETKMESNVQACTVMPDGMGTKNLSATPIATDNKSGTGLAPCSMACMIESCSCHMQYLTCEASPHKMQGKQQICSLASLLQVHLWRRLRSELPPARNPVTSDDDAEH